MPAPALVTRSFLYREARNQVIVLLTKKKKKELMMVEEDLASFLYRSGSRAVASLQRWLL